MTISSPAPAPVPSSATVFSAGNCVLWLDPSDTTTLTHPVTPDHITSIVDKSIGAVYNYANQTNTMSSTSPTPTQDATSLLSAALTLKSGYLWTVGNPTTPAPLVLGDNQGRFAFFYVGAFNAHTSTERKTWLFANEVAYASTNYPPSVTNTGGLLLTRVANTVSTFVLTIYDAQGHNASSPQFTLSNNSLVLSVVADQNQYGFPTLSVRVNGVVEWTYDSGQFNPSNLNFSGISFTSLGSGPNVDSGIETTGEVIGYQGAVSSNTVLSLESYLTNKWSPVITTPIIGGISNQLGVLAQLFQAVVPISSAQTVSVTTVAANVGENWTATAPIDGTNNWKITGIFPSSLTNFSLVLTVVDVTGTQTVVATFPLITTANGTESSEQLLILANSPNLWLDFSDATTLTTTNGHITYVVDKTSTSGFTLSSSETIVPDLTSLKVPSLAFAKASESSSGFNYGLMLDPLSRPDLFTNDPTVFLSSSPPANTPMGNGIVVTGTDGSYTLILLLDYNALAGGSPLANLIIKNDFPDLAPDYCVQKWGITTPTLGSAPATVYVSDSVTDAVVITGSTLATPNNQQATTQLNPGAPAIVVWRYDPVNGPVIRINGNPVSTAFTHGSASAWSSVQQKLTQLAGIHSLGSLGTFIAYPRALNDATLAPIESHLISKSFIVVGASPTFGNLSLTQAYLSSGFTATLTIGNSSSDPITATMTASAGAFVLSQDSTTPTLWHITGTMPATAGSLTLSIVAEQSNATATHVYALTALPLAALPTIGSLSLLSAPKSSAYLGQLTIVNAHNANGTLAVSVIASAGSGWVIAATSTANVYQITGTMPSVVDEFNLLVTAQDQTNDGLSTNTVAQTFVIQTTGSAPVQATQYPLDLTGVSPSNLIVNEVQTLTADNGAGNQFVVPILAPYFGTSLVVQYLGAGNQLLTAVPHIDYDPICELQTLSRATASPIFSAISFLNLSITGKIVISYQALGGNFSIDRQKIYNTLANLIVNQKQVDWSNIVNLLLYYPVAPHQHNVESDLVGTAGLIASLTAIQNAYAGNSQASDITAITAHIALVATSSFNAHPHQLTAAQVGLSSVPNYPVATDAQATQSNNNTTFLTPHGAVVAAQSNIPVATSNVAGVLALNTGSAGGDDSNSVDGLTAAGAIALISSSSANMIKSAFTSGEQIGQVSPYPLVFPLYWNGIQYSNLTAFIYAIETYIGVEYLSFNQNTGQMYFPKNVTVPNLTTTSSSTATGTRNATTADNTSLPIITPTGAW